MMFRFIRSKKRARERRASLYFHLVCVCERDDDGCAACMRDIPKGTAACIAGSGARVRFIVVE